MIFEKKKRVAGLTTGFETAVVGYSVASAGDTPANPVGIPPSLPLTAGRHFFSTLLILSPHRALSTASSSPAVATW